jgi:hypothetical protein
MWYFVWTFKYLNIKTRKEKKRKIQTHRCVLGRIPSIAAQFPFPTCQPHGAYARKLPRRLVGPPCLWPPCPQPHTPHSQTGRAHTTASATRPRARFSGWRMRPPGQTRRPPTNVASLGTKPSRTPTLRGFWPLRFKKRVGVLLYGYIIWYAPSSPTRARRGWSRGDRRHSCS